MKITIKTISGKVYQLEDVEADLTVEKLKILAEKETEIVPDCQRLIFKGKVLKNEQTLADAKLCDGDCIIIVKSRKKKKQPTPEETKEARNAPQVSANANVAPPPAQGNAQPNPANPFGFMVGQGQPPVPLNLDAFGAMFRGNAQANPFGFQAQPAAANAQQPAATAASNANVPAANSTNGPAAANPFAAFPFAAMMGQGANNQRPDMNAIMQMLQSPMVQEMLRSPAMQQMMQNMMANPQMLQNLMRNNPMMNGLLQNLGNPAAAAQPAPASQPNANPAAANPNAAPNAASAANANAQAVGPNNQPAAANPQAPQANPLALLLSQLNNQQPNNAAAPNLFQAFINPQQMRQQPPVGQPQGLNDAQAREMYATELGQLQNMGFLDEARNLRALRETAGSVEAAINMLLS